MPAPEPEFVIPPHAEQDDRVVCLSLLALAVTARFDAERPDLFDGTPRQPVTPVGAVHEFLFRLLNHGHVDPVLVLREFPPPVAGATSLSAALDPPDPLADVLPLIRKGEYRLARAILFGATAPGR